MQLSVVIPVLNEENYIGKLLNHLSEQTLGDFEVIVVDGKSTDRTIKVVDEFGKRHPNLVLKLIKAPHKGVSYQRNLGANTARADLILFLDADVAFDNNFLANILGGFDAQKYAIATSPGYPEGEGNVMDYLTCILYNIYQSMTKSLKPEAYGWMILVKKEMHKRIGGFNESLFFGEDSDYCRRVVAHGGKFQILKKVKIYYSVRRIVKEGRFRFYRKMFAYFFYSKLYGRQMAQRKIGYEVGQF